MKIELFLDEGEEYPQLFSVWRVDQKTDRADLTTRRNYVDDRKLWDKCRKTDDENIRLKAENAKLREQVTQLQFDWESERDYADQMEDKERRAVAENDKLRELVVRMRPICMEGKRCTFADRIYINSTMEELGIEVTDA